MTVSERPQDQLATLRGTFRLGSRVRGQGAAEENIGLGILQVFAAVQGDRDSEPGQWIFSVDPDESGTQRRDFFIEVASRLGLLPMQFARSFEDELRREEPLCLLADTSALYDGTLTQALALRAGRPTHVAIADQAMMEIQQQREQTWALREKLEAPDLPAAEGGRREETSVGRWARAAARAKYLSAAGRALLRLRVAGHVVHVARPPAALVRYFGGSRGSMEGDEGSPGGDLVGSNVLRDRLILEAAFQQRVELPGVRLVLLTDDALLAEQAKLEGLSVGFGWLATTLEPRLLTSPFINPRTLKLNHVPVRDLLDELVWSCSVVTLQREQEGKVLVARVPTQKRERILAAMDGYRVLWRQENVGNSVWVPEVPATFMSSVPRKSPTAQKLLERLLDLLAGQGARTASPREEQPEAEDVRISDAYLRALGWLSEQDDSMHLTERGRQLATRWLKLKPRDVEGWVAWMADAGGDFQKLAPLEATLREVEANPDIKDDDLAARRGEHVRTVSAQMSLASAFGRAVRLDGKNWRVAPWTDAEAERAVLDAIEAVLRKGPEGVRAARVASVFTTLLRDKPMGLPVFRGALLRLRDAGRVRFTGSSPEKSRVRIMVLQPVTEGAGVRATKVDLGDGDYLLPDTPCVVAEIVPASARTQPTLREGG
jgi:hypothetical protein